MKYVKIFEDWKADLHKSQANYNKKLSGVINSGSPRRKFRIGDLVYDGETNTAYRVKDFDMVGNIITDNGNKIDGYKAVKYNIDKHKNAQMSISS